MKIRFHDCVSLVETTKTNIWTTCAILLCIKLVLLVPPNIWMITNPSRSLSSSDLSNLEISIPYKLDRMFTAIKLSAVAVYRIWMTWSPCYTTVFTGSTWTAILSGFRSRCFCNWEVRTSIQGRASFVVHVNELRFENLQSLPEKVAIVHKGDDNFATLLWSLVMATDPLNYSSLSRQEEPRTSASGVQETTYGSLLATGSSVDDSELVSRSLVLDH